MTSLASPATGPADAFIRAASFPRRIALRFAAWLARHAAARRDRVACEALHAWSDAELRDIGLTRADLPSRPLGAWIGDDGATPWAGHDVRLGRF